jgi:hypothetical protein
MGDRNDPAFLETLTPRATAVMVPRAETRPLRLTIQE